MPQVFYKILLEDGGYLLQEDSGKLLLESVFSDTGKGTMGAKIAKIGKTYLYSPPIGSYRNIPVEFQWYIPSNAYNKPMSFEIQIDKTSSAFGDLEKDVLSYSGNAMEYHDGITWVGILVSGVANSYAGSLARYVTNLTNGQKWWRVRAIIG
jgi:hypothetical protein